MCAELRLFGFDVSGWAAERAEGFRSRRIGSAGVAVCGGCVPAMRLNSDAPYGDGAAQHLGLLPENAGQSDLQG
jgi:hypothetical protein